MRRRDGRPSRRQQHLGPPRRHEPFQAGTLLSGCGRRAASRAVPLARRLECPNTAADVGSRYWLKPPLTYSFIHKRSLVGIASSAVSVASAAAAEVTGALGAAAAAAVATAGWGEIGGGAAGTTVGCAGSGGPPHGTPLCAQCLPESGPLRSRPQRLDRPSPAAVDAPLRSCQGAVGGEGVWRRARDVFPGVACVLTPSVGTRRMMPPTRCRYDGHARRRVVAPPAARPSSVAPGRPWRAAAQPGGTPGRDFPSPAFFSCVALDATAAALRSGHRGPFFHFCSHRGGETSFRGGRGGNPACRGWVGTRLCLSNLPLQASSPFLCSPSLLAVSVRPDTFWDLRRSLELGNRSRVS